MLDGRWRAKVERGLEPVGVGLHRLGISADGLTIIGLVIAIATAFAIATGHLVLGVIGVILTGSGIDGATGIQAIKRMGGTTIVQDPSRAAHPGMPQAAYATGCIDYRLPLEEIAPTIVELVAPPTTEKARLIHE